MAKMGRYEKNLLGRLSPETDRTMCVYRYIDIEDERIKYVGIVRKGKLSSRIMSHSQEDEWCKGKTWYIEFFPCETKSEIEAFESHLIALYGTDQYFNVKKAGWGINRFLPDVEDWWKPAQLLQFDSFGTMRMFAEFKRILQDQRFDEAKEIMELFEMEDADGKRKTED